MRRRRRGRREEEKRRLLVMCTLEHVLMTEGVMRSHPQDGTIYGRGIPFRNEEEEGSENAYES